MREAAPTRLLLLFGGQSAEHDVSCMSARHVLAAVDPAKYSVEAIGITRSGGWVRAEQAQELFGNSAADWPDQLAARGAEIDPFALLRTDVAGHQPVVFPVLHGPQGEDGTIQGLLELLGVPYVGSGVLSSALCMDKVKSNEMFAHHGIAQANWRVLHASDLGEQEMTRVIAALGLPLFVKPANMGSSVGVSRVDDAGALPAAVEMALSYDERAVFEEAIVGREIECSVLGNFEPVASVGGEIVTGAEWYDYTDKYEAGAELLVPAPLDLDQLSEMQRIALAAYRAVRCEGLARVDFFFEPDGRGWLVNEVNTMPGFTPISMYPKMWAASGVTYPELIDRLVGLAIERHRRRVHHRRTDH